MKKFVLVSDGKDNNHGTFQFIASLHHKEPFLLTGAFFHMINYGLLIPGALASTGTTFVEITNEEKAVYLSAIKEFVNFCTTHHIEHRVHHESEEWDINDLVKESRFSDMLIVNGETFFKDFEGEEPNHFLKEILKQSECPVMVVPQQTKPIKKIIVAYDGNKESMYALKMFCNTLPSYTQLPVEINYWVKKSDEEIPDGDNLKEYVTRHFPNVSIHQRFFDPKKYLSGFLEANMNAILICGSYNRSAISKWLKKSFAEEVIKKHIVPVFISHPA